MSAYVGFESTMARKGHVHALKTIKFPHIPTWGTGLPIKFPQVVHSLPPPPSPAGIVFKFLGVVF